MADYFYADRLFTALERTDPEPGTLLVAAPGMVSPEFARTVVLLLEHTTDHTLGVILNRRSELAVANVMPDWVDAVAKPQALYIGGPVGPQAAIGVGVVKNRVDLEAAPQLTRVANRVVYVDMRQDPFGLNELIDGMRIFVGYAEWEPGQLDEEIERGDWYVAPALPADVIAAANVDLWGDVLRRQPMPLPLFSTYPATIDDN